MTDTPRMHSGQLGRIAILDLGDAITEHAHPHAHVLIKLGGPDGSFQVAGKHYPLCDDALLAINPWVPHSGARRMHPAATRVLALYLNAHGADVARGLPAPRTFSGRVLYRMNKDVKSLANRLHRLMSDGQATSGAVDDLLRAVQSAHGVDPSRMPASPRVDYRVRRAIEEMTADPLLAQDLTRCACIAGLSRSHFFALFRQSTGVSPRLFCNALRLEAAIHRLRDTRTPIGSVADGLGFRAPGHFTRFLLRHVGSTPRALRASFCGIDS